MYICVGVRELGAGCRVFGGFRSRVGFWVGVSGRVRARGFSELVVWLTGWAGIGVRTVEENARDDSAPIVFKD